MKKLMTRKWAIWLGIAIVLIVAIVAITASSLNGRAGVVSDATGSVASPVRSAVNAAVDWLEGVYGYIYKYDQLLAENTELRRQLTEAQEELSSATQAEEENARLRELLNLSEKHSDFEYESAKITEWTISNWASTFTISKGEASGIEVGDCVITESGELCGQVIELGTSWATVRTIIDVDISIGVLVGEGGSAALCIGDYNLMQSGCAKLTYATFGTQLVEGSTIYTSGSGENFPAGLIIGTIAEVRTEAGGQSTYGVITPTCEFSSLSQVFVVKEFIVVE